MRPGGVGRLVAYEASVVGTDRVRGSGECCCSRAAHTGHRSRRLVVVLTLARGRVVASALEHGLLVVHLASHLLGGALELGAEGKPEHLWVSEYC